MLGSGPDVWEIVAVAKDNGGSVADTAAYLEIDPRLVESALRDYGADRDEIDDWIERVHALNECDESTWRAALRGRPDRVHFASLPDEQRAIVTRDLGDFRPLLAEALRRGSSNYGLVCVPARFPLNHDGIGRLVAALDALLRAHPEVGAAISLGGEIWLQDPTGS